MESLQDTFTVRTREGREYSGLTLSSLRIAAAQKIFSMEDAVRSDKVAGAWTPLARVLNLPEPTSAPRALPNQAPVRGPDLLPGPRASTGIALDLHSDTQRTPSATPPTRTVAPGSLPSRPMVLPNSLNDEDEGPARHRLRIAGAFLLFLGILGMVAYALGRPSVANAVTMLVNTGLGIALLMNLQQIRQVAVGWVMAGWGLMTLGGVLAGGCFGLVLVGLFSGLVYGGPACLLWGEECPRGRFWTGVTIMGLLVLLMVLGLILIAVAGAALFKQIRL